MPYRSFLPLLSDAYPQLRTWQDMDFLRYRLARRYQVTETVIAYRMESLKYEFFQYLSGTPLEDLHFLSRRELSKQGVSILSLNELEDRFTKFQEPNQSLKTPRCFGSDDCYQGAFRFLGESTSKQSILPLNSPGKIVAFSFSLCYNNFRSAGVAEQADARDLKSLGSNIVPVQVRSPAPSG